MGVGTVWTGVIKQRTVFVCAYTEKCNEDCKSAGLRDTGVTARQWLHDLPTSGRLFYSMKGSLAPGICEWYEDAEDTGKVCMLV